MKTQPTTETLLLVSISMVSISMASNPMDSSSKKWKLVDSYTFDSFRSAEDLIQSPKFLIDDEAENLCSGENIHQYSCHRKENLNITRDGYLELIADLNSLKRNNRFMFNTAKISSKKSWLYGRFEMRAILPEGKLLRPAFVLRPKHYEYSPNDWLENGQINAMVYSQQPGSVVSSLNYKMTTPMGASYIGRRLKTHHNLTRSFHVYTVEWTEGKIRCSLDNYVYFDHKVSRPFDRPFYFVLQLGVGGPEFDHRHYVMRREDFYQWTNNRFIIDYIRIYQQKPNSYDDNDVLKSKTDRLSNDSSSNFKVENVFLFLILNFITINVVNLVLV